MVIDEKQTFRIGTQNTPTMPIYRLTITPQIYDMCTSVTLVPATALSIDNTADPFAANARHYWKP